MPSAILAVVVHPFTHHFRIGRILWALGAYMEAVSVLPQLHLMQNAKVLNLHPNMYTYIYIYGCLPSLEVTLFCFETSSDD